jgi:hypothetical protein
VLILKGLDEMGFAAAQELSSWMRLWLIRYIRLNSVEIVPVPINLSIKKIKDILSSISSAPTGTYGILEQRFVDVLALSLHSEDQWRSRGLGDSVNANNNSKRKLGDCDFQNSIDKIVVAYEAHGGKLLRIYCEGHIRTLRSTLKRRLEDLEAVAVISKWKLRLIFVAYDFDSNLPTVLNMDGLRIEIEYKTFDSLYQEVDIRTPSFFSAFQKFFIEIVNMHRTPLFVRNKIHSIVNGTGVR